MKKLNKAISKRKGDMRLVTMSDLQYSDVQVYKEGIKIKIEKPPEQILLF